MAPEQIEGEPVDERTDIYSLGITAFEIATGQKPFPNDDIQTIMDFHLKGKIPDPRTINPDLPEPLSRFIYKSTRRNPSERYHSAKEAMKELLPLVRKSGSRYTGHDNRKKQMSSIYLFYSENQKEDLNNLLEEFSTKAKALGINLKGAEFDDFNRKIS